MPETNQQQGYGLCFTCGQRFIAEKRRPVDAEKVRKAVDHHGRAHGHRVLYRKITERVYDFTLDKPRPID